MSPRNTQLWSALAACLMVCPAAFGHGPTPRGPQDLWTAWPFDPLVLALLGMSALLYVAGLSRMWRAAGIGHGVQRWEAFCFGVGWVTLFVSLASPLHTWGDALFSVHMTQHELLMLVAAPLMVLGHPMPVMMRALPASWAVGLARASHGRAWSLAWGWLSNAFVAWLVHGVVLWAWHVPALFQAAVRNDAVHALQHASFFGSALLFWWAAMQGGRAVGYGAAVLYMFTTALHSGLLGALITLTGSVWYPIYGATTRDWGLTPMEDQQIGGLIMWIPAGTVYIVAALALLAGWMRESERKVLRWEGVSTSARSIESATS